QFLQTIGVTAEVLAATREGPEVRAFNHALLGTCCVAEPELAFACLGIIEYTFADISASIGNAVRQRGWVEDKTLVHYTLHSEIDRRHAQEFFSEIESDWAQGGPARMLIEDGMEF